MIVVAVLLFPMSVPIIIVVKFRSNSGNAVQMSSDQNEEASGDGLVAVACLYLKRSSINNDKINSRHIMMYIILPTLAGLRSVSVLG